MSVRLAVPVIVCCCALASADDLRVLPESSAAGPTQGMLLRYLKGQANAAFDRRRAEYEKLKTPEQIEDYQQRLRAFFVERLGGSPERTPLNAKVVGRVKGDGCRIEKVVFESRPGHFVTSLLYLPATKPPYKAVLVPCGHTANGKIGYQRVCVLLARHGLAAFCYDPIGQGERYQILDEAGRPRFKSTTEHTLVGAGSILVGRNTASYRVWDGMRALDYLETREDVNADGGFGCTGNSGGGTLTAYLMALDPRIACAAPSCCVTTFRRRMATIGPGDAEQNVYGQTAFGMDHIDYTLMRAPQPTLLLAATRDFVDIEGAWQIFRDSKRLYTRLGHPERVDLIEADAKHGFSRHLRVGATRWMRRWLLDLDDAVTEPDLEMVPAHELLCTPDGQAQLLPGARSVMDFNAEAAESYAARRKAVWAGDLDEARDEVRRLAGIRPPAGLPNAKPKPTGTVKRNGYRIEKLVLEPDAGLRLPMLLFRPNEATGVRRLLVNGEGKSADVERAESLAAKGETVLLVDLRGCGETGRSSRNRWGGDWDAIFLTYLLEQSMAGTRAEDVLLAARYLETLDGRQGKVQLTGTGVAAVPALHAAAVEPGLFSKVELRGGPSSWMEAVREPERGSHLVHAVHGALRAYDLPDLVRSAEAGGVKVVRRTTD